MKSIQILDVKISLQNLDQVLQSVHQFVDEKKPHQICTVNTEFVMAAQKNEDFKNVINQADIAVADGAGIQLAAKLLHLQIPDRITGVDLTQQIARISAEQGFSLFLLGGRGGAAQATANFLIHTFPTLKIVGVSEKNPEDKDLISEITRVKPDVLLVAFGAPKQDLWIAKNMKELNVPVMMGVGGTFDYLAGHKKRPPLSWRNSGFEWLWRLIHEPSRWKRQLALPKMFLLIFWSKLFKS